MIQINTKDTCDQYIILHFDTAGQQMALPISPFFNYLLLVYVIKMSLFDINYEYYLLLKYTFMQIVFSDFMIKSIRKTKFVNFKRCCYSHGLLTNQKRQLFDESLDKTVLFKELALGLQVSPKSCLLLFLKLFLNQ